MREVPAGEMHGFKIINIFPEASCIEEWEDFAEAVVVIIKKRESQEAKVSVSAS